MAAFLDGNAVQTLDEGEYLGLSLVLGELSYRFTLEKISSTKARLRQLAQSFPARRLRITTNINLIIAFMLRITGYGLYLLGSSEEVGMSFETLGTGTVSANRT